MQIDHSKTSLAKDWRLYTRPSRLWFIIIAAQGERDQSTNVVDFADDVISLSDDVKNDPGCEARCTAVAVTDLNFKASLLAFAFKMKPPGPRLKSATYRDIAASGNWLVKLAKLRGAKFISVSCHVMVDDTGECTALG
jgi:hypothetical protein